MDLKEVADYIGIKHAVALNSGTAAIHMAVKALEVKQDIVLFFTNFATSLNYNIRSIYVFSDSEYESWNMDPNALEAFEKIRRQKL